GAEEGILVFAIRRFDRAVAAIDLVAARGADQEILAGVAVDDRAGAKRADRVVADPAIGGIPAVNQPDNVSPGIAVRDPFGTLQQDEVGEVGRVDAGAAAVNRIGATSAQDRIASGIAVDHGVVGGNAGDGGIAADECDFAA